MAASIFDVLDEDVHANRQERGEIQFTAAQARLAQRERYLAYEIAGSRHDMGDPAGLLAAQRALLSSQTHPL